MSLGHVVVTGAGLVGCLAATYLADLGYRVTVVERHADLRRDTLRSGRSINLTLCERGWHALRQVGAEDAIRSLAIPATGRDIHHADGSRSRQPYGPDGEAIWSISRNDLNRSLLDLAESRPEVEILFRTPCVDVDLEGPGLTVGSAEGDRRRLRPDHLLGTDGAYSTVRRAMQHDAGIRFQYSQHYVDQGYKELRLAAGAEGEARLDRDAIHIWPRGRFFLIGFANLDGSFTLSFHLPFEGEPSFASLATREDVLGLLRDEFPDLAEDAEALADQFLDGPVSSMVTVRCSPWSHRGKVALLGDASHAIVPSYGQGANSGFEDCYLLARALEEHDHDWRLALPAFEEHRKPDTDVIADISLQHFREIKERVDDEEFLRRKRVERALSAHYGDEFLPTYEAISFTRLPYRKVREEEHRQRELVARILAEPALPDDLCQPEARRILDPLTASYRQRTPDHE